MIDPIVIDEDNDDTSEEHFGPASQNNLNRSPRVTRSSFGQNTTPSLRDTTERSPVVSTKKRKLALTTPSPKSKAKQLPPVRVDEDDDDGTTCPICFDQWVMSGEHRLISLKCGHLFGESCIRRWLQECATGSKCCPSCKAKATTRDFRYLYAKRLCAIDNTEAENLKALLDEKITDFQKLTYDKNVVDFELQQYRNRVQQLQDENDYLRRRLANPVPSGGVQSSQQMIEAHRERVNRLKTIKLFLEKNIDISKEPGCRCMISSR